MAIGFTKIRTKTLHEAFQKLNNDVCLHGTKMVGSKSLEKFKSLKNQSVTVEVPFFNQIYGVCSRDPYVMMNEFFTSYKHGLFDELFEENILYEILREGLYSAEKMIILGGKGIFFNMAIYVEDSEMQMVANFGKLNILDLQPVFFQCSILLIILADYYNLEPGEITICSQLFYGEKFEVDKKIPLSQKYKISKVELDYFLENCNLDSIVHYQGGYSFFFESYIHLSNLRKFEKNGNLKTLKDYASEHEILEVWRLYDSRNNR